MKPLIQTYQTLHRNVFERLQFADGIAPLLLRLYLIPVFWMAGSSKIDFTTLMPYQSTVDWFGNPEWGLGMPLPALMAFLAGWTFHGQQVEQVGEGLVLVDHEFSCGESCSSSTRRSSISARISDSCSSEAST